MGWNVRRGGQAPRGLKEEGMCFDACVTETENERAHVYFTLAPFLFLSPHPSPSLIFSPDNDEGLTWKWACSVNQLM